MGYLGARSRIGPLKVEIRIEKGRDAAAETAEALEDLKMHLDLRSIRGCVRRAPGPKPPLRR